MGGEIRINLTNFITIGLMAFAFIFVAMKVLPMVGLGSVSNSIRG